MSPRNSRAAAAALIGVLAGGAHVGAAGAAAPNPGASAVRASGGSDQGDPENATDLVPGPQSSGDPSDPGAGGTDGSTPQDGSSDDTASPPSSDDQSTTAQCGQIAITDALPTVITCGPLTISITFNTVTTTTTVTTVSAPITAANGSISTATTAVTNQAPATPTVARKPAPSKKPKTTSKHHPVAGTVHKHKPAKKARSVKVRVRFGPRPSR